VRVTCDYSMCGDARCRHCFPEAAEGEPTAWTVSNAPDGFNMRSVLSLNMYRGEAPPTLDCDGRRYLCIDPDEWARVSSAARAWSLLVQALAHGEPSPDMPVLALSLFHADACYRCDDMRGLGEAMADARVAAEVEADEAAE